MKSDSLPTDLQASAATSSVPRWLMAGSALAVAAATVVAGAAPASASALSPTSKNSELASLETTATYSDAVARALVSAATLQPSGHLVTASDEETCGYAEKQVTGRNHVNWVLFTYRQRETFCWDGTSIVGEPHRTVYVSTHWGWVYNGLQDHTEGWISEPTLWQSNTQGSFSVIVKGVPINRSPWINMTLHGDGTADAELGS